MKVKCIFNKGSSLPKDLLGNYSGFKENTVFPLVLEKEYLVYGIIMHRGYVWYYLCDEDYTYYPIWNPSPLFDVVDNKISKYWVYSFRRGESHLSTSVEFVYPEWANDPFYYDSLTNGDDEQVNIFKYYKELMDLEFPDTSIPEKDSAILVEDEWLICPYCFNSWQSQSTSGMVICSVCKRILHNPLFGKKCAGEAI